MSRRLGGSCGGLTLTPWWSALSRMNMSAGRFGMAGMLIEMPIVIGGGGYMVTKNKPIPMRQILIELPEDKMMRLVKRAGETGKSAHEFAACKLLEAIK